ncbi:hypothetical protein BFJ72_g7256 [Fusarium proliferatum]|uniref:Uncharacterized protein n=1 Tax=Gibberella intermedia TaxID=948311 RepID=A0A420TA84_GIBIN|nr:hypothetical protein BFJ72_g7256 [Fusarium proliferatum]
MAAPEEPGIVQVVGEPKQFKLETLTRDLERIHGEGNAGWKLVQAHKVKLVSITIETEDIAALVEHYESLGVDVEWEQKKGDSPQYIKY